ncbi:MAG: membrane protein insertase YidC [Corynebacteriales bacterium]|nr:membrane protein insertase YidC [Mycobacteriales bacterium]
MNWIYTGISWILLKWHSLWALMFGESSNISWVLAIVFLVLTVRAILFPVFVKQIKSQRKMQELQPRIKELQDKHKNDRPTLQVEMAKLLKEEKANPLMGCLPMLLQIPVFLGLFHVLRSLDPTSSRDRSAMINQYGWTADQFEHASHAKLFGAPIAAAFSSPSKFLDTLGVDRPLVQVVAGVLVITMVLTTYITQRQMIARTGANATGPQAMIQKVMLYGIPLSLMISGVIFPIGVLIYWVVQNFFSMGQQFWVLKKMPPPGAATAKKEISAETAKAMAPKPGVKPDRGPKKAAGGDDSTTTSGGSTGPGRKPKARKRKGGRI